MKDSSCNPIYRSGLTRQGFTLIELSIVLVIIGLIVGGVLVGQDLIKAAKLRRVIKQVEGYNAAVNTFRLKYNALPGDMSNATQVWGSDANGCPFNTVSDWADAGYVPTCDGNGDGIIGVYTAGWTTSDARVGEWLHFWQHLANAGLIQGQYRGGHSLGALNFPEGPYGVVPRLEVGSGTIGNSTKGAILMYQGVVFSDMSNGVIHPSKADTRYIFSLGAMDGNNPNGTNWSPVFSPLDAYAIDSKADDGMPFIGKITGTHNLWGDHCGVNTTGQYRSEDAVSVPSGGSPSFIGCALYFDAAF